MAATVCIRHRCDESQPGESSSQVDLFLAEHLLR